MSDDISLPKSFNSSSAPQENQGLNPSSNQNIQNQPIMNELQSSKTECLVRMKGLEEKLLALMHDRATFHSVSHEYERRVLEVMNETEELKRFLDNQQCGRESKRLPSYEEVELQRASINEMESILASKLRELKLEPKE